MNGMDFGEIMKMAQQAQAQAARMQEESEQRLAGIQVEGSAGGGMVRVEMNGALELRRVLIEPEVIKPEDKEMLEELVAAAVSEAIRRALKEKEAVQQGQVSQMSQGLGGMPGMGGMDLSKLFGGGPPAP